MKKILLILIALLSFASCMKDGGVSWSKTMYGDFTSRDTSDPTKNYSYEDQICVMEMATQWEALVCFTFNGLKFTAGGKQLSLYLKDVPFLLYHSDDKDDPLYNAWVFDEEKIIPLVNNVPAEEYTLSHFKGVYTDTSCKLEFDINIDSTKYHSVFEF